MKDRTSILAAPALLKSDTLKSYSAVFLHLSVSSWDMIWDTVPSTIIGTAVKDE